MSRMSADAHQLRDAHPAVEHQRQHAVVPRGDRRGFILHAVQQLERFLQRQVFGDRLALRGRVQILGGIFFQVAGLGGQIFVQRADGRNLARTAGGAVAQDVQRKMEKVIDVAERHRADQLLGDVVDLDLRKLLGILRQLFEHLDRFEIPQKGAQLDVIAVDRFGRTSLDGFQVEQKTPAGCRDNRT